MSTYTRMLFDRNAIDELLFDDLTTVFVSSSIKLRKKKITFLARRSLFDLSSYFKVYWVYVFATIKTPLENKFYNGNISYYVNLLSFRRSTFEKRRVPFRSTSVCTKILLGVAHADIYRTSVRNKNALY